MLKRKKTSFSRREDLFLLPNTKTVGFAFSSVRCRENMLWSTLTAMINVQKMTDILKPELKIRRAQRFPV